MKGKVFNIQRLSIHDGPGIRTTVFFKGCPLRCLWCSNPESQRPEPEIACFKNRCVSCGYCAEVCPKKIIDAEDGFFIRDRDACDLCLKCVKECCTGAKKLDGEFYTEEGLLEEILKDREFYEKSGGGVTFSGGEPLMQGEFLLAMLKQCKDAGLHTAIETTGFAGTELFLEAAKYLDLVFMDLKQMDDARHRELTGVSNQKILENLRALGAVHKNITVRTPVIPGLNDSEENIRATADFAAGAGAAMYELLPYHNLGENKYAQLGRDYELSDIKPPSEERMEALANAARDAIGGRDTKVHVMPSM